MAGIGGADGHALRHVVQGNGGCHDHTGDHQGQMAAGVLLAFLQIVAVNQFIQLIGGFWMSFVYVGHFGIGVLVDHGVENIDHRYTQQNRTNDRTQPGVGGDGLGNQVKADHTEHNTAGKAQQQTDGAVGILSEHSANQAAQPCAGDTGNGGDDKKHLNCTHSISLFSC